MNEFYKRLLSGAIYVALLISGIIFHKIAFFTIILLFSLICLWEFQRIIHLKSIILYLILILSLISFSFFEIPQYIIYGVLLITIITQLVLLYDLIYIRIIPMFEKKKYLVSIFYLISCFLFLSLIPFSNHQYEPVFVLGIFILIWVNDSFAYLVGKNLGKHKLYERISPKKTVEGFLGGLFFAMLASLVLAQFSKSLTIFQWVLFGLIVGFFGTLGDLIQSKFKRQAGVKDSGTIMPGHGGVFDRLDSVLYASPFVFLFLQIIDYVS